MDEQQLTTLLRQVRDRELDIEAALSRLRLLPYQQLDEATLDTHRALRTAYPEVIFCQGKTVAQVRDIVSAMLEWEVNILGTRADESMFQAVAELTPRARYNPLARCLIVEAREPVIANPAHFIAVITAGTADLPVAEEAVETARLLGNRVEKIVDVGVAGIHRLFARLEQIRAARVLIVVAGMEGALPSVVGGLVDKPVIAVPTGVGYGANFGGISALLGMLTTCAAGVGVVNIDNGFGAAYLASLINRL